jgi:hypothetical protein
MKTSSHLLFICSLITPLLVFAKDSADTPEERIEFSASSQRAFDRSGHVVTHHILPGGTVMAKHNGSVGNITVARRAADGTIETFCTTDLAAAKAWMAGDNPSESHTTLFLEGERR